MNAKQKNTSERTLFLSGGRLDILLWSYQEMNHQSAEAKDDAQAARFGHGLELLEECPCGCGLKNDVCEARREIVTAINDEIPF